MTCVINQRIMGGMPGDSYKSIINQLNFAVVCFISKPHIWEKFVFKFSWIIHSYPLADCFEIRTCLIDKCLCSQNINKYSNKPAKGYKRKIRRFKEDLATLVFSIFWKQNFNFLYPDFNDFLSFSYRWNRITSTFSWPKFNNIWIWKWSLQFESNA